MCNLGGSQKLGFPFTGNIGNVGTCQNDWLVTGPLAHTRYIPHYIGYVTEGGFRDIPRDFCPAEDIKAARQGVCNRPAFQGVCNCNRGLVARNATTPLFGTPPCRDNGKENQNYTGFGDSGSIVGFPKLGVPILRGPHNED